MIILRFIIALLLKERDHSNYDLIIIIHELIVRNLTRE